MTLRTNDLIFLAMDSPDYACLPSDPMRPGVRLDYSQPIQSPWMRGVGQPLASANPDNPPCSMVESWNQQQGYDFAEFDRRMTIAIQRLRNVEAGAKLARRITPEQVSVAVERIRKCQNQH